MLYLRRVTVVNLFEPVDDFEHDNSIDSNKYEYCMFASVMSVYIGNANCLNILLRLQRSSKYNLILLNSLFYHNLIV